MAEDHSSLTAEERVAITIMVGSNIYAIRVLTDERQITYLPPTTTMPRSTILLLSVWSDELWKVITVQSLPMV
jgi:hypothetical protein